MGTCLCYTIIFYTKKPEHRSISPSRQEQSKTKKNTRNMLNLKLQRCRTLIWIAQNSVSRWQQLGGIDRLSSAGPQELFTRKKNQRTLTRAHGQGAHDEILQSS
ncbi:MAG: hypothetical protein EZS28_013885 [Streblomastix strix]|uniref:Uncharacterized protein n=1 Tax=Streblomastix strix TaxID=222440 RepID=A0A5J4W6X0_9EUKA|nr:MAG: hypothetical protein EZS28_013885 [Streblomastix strix]